MNNVDFDGEINAQDLSIERRDDDMVTIYDNKENNENSTPSN